MSILDPLYDGVAHAIVGIHSAIEPVFGQRNGYGWALSIVLLTLGVRLILFPLFVKQIKSQRTMQVMAPKMKEIKEKYKNDRQRMNQELMALQKEHGNPILGCLPVLAQIPLFIALFRVLTSITPKMVNGSLTSVPSHGLTTQQVQTIGSAKVFGVPLAAALRSPENVLHYLGTSSTGVAKLLSLVLIVAMCLTTFLTQKQIQGRSPSPDPQQRMQQKLMLYAAPGMLAISGYLYPIGVLLYWLTTNLWSLGQQFFVLRRMPPIQPVLATGADRAAARAADTPQPSRRADKAGKNGKLGRAGKAAAQAPVERAVSPDAPAPKARLQQRHVGPSTTPVSGQQSARAGSGRPPKRGKGGKNRRGGRR